MKRYLSAIALAALLAGGKPSWAAANKEVAFGSLEAIDVAAARPAAEWLKSIGKTDPATIQRFEAIWKDADHTVLDRTAETFALGDRPPPSSWPMRAIRAPRSDQGARDTEGRQELPVSSAPTSAWLMPGPCRKRRIHEESLDRAQEVSAPSKSSIRRPTSSTAPSPSTPCSTKPKRRKPSIACSMTASARPERYRTVSALMLLDMQTWKDKDLGAIARKMENIERRLDLARGGPQTQKLQKEVFARLDELIKELENKSKKVGRRWRRQRRRLPRWRHSRIGPAQRQQSHQPGDRERHRQCRRHGPCRSAQDAQARRGMGPHAAPRTGPRPARFDPGHVGPASRSHRKLLPQLALARS